jgi:hypothetical protein
MAVPLFLIEYMKLDEIEDENTILFRFKNVCCLLVYNKSKDEKFFKICQKTVIFLDFSHQ